MSELVREHVAVQPDQLATDLDNDFRFVAERLPLAIKQPGVESGATMSLCELEGLGSMAVTYVGKSRAGSDPHDNFVIRLSMQLDGYDGRLGFYKDYALTYQSLRKDGPVVDKQPTTAEDFEGCPAPLEDFQFAMNALRTEFERLHTTPDAQVIYLDDYRQE